MRKLLFYSSLLVMLGLMTDTAVPQPESPPEGLQSNPITTTDPLQALDLSAPGTPDGHGGSDPLDQGNDACPATVIAALPYTDTGTTVGRANNWNTAASCAGGSGGSNAPDVIYSFTPSVNQSVIISTCGSAFNTIVEVRTGGTCPGSSQYACGDAGCGGDGEVRINLYAGTTYYIIIDGYSTQSGNYTLSVRAMCNVYLHAGDLTECTETVDSSHARLDCDGGPCNLSFGGEASYTWISCGQTYAGKGFTYTRAGVPHSDTDWYRFVVTEVCTVRISVEAEFPWMLSAGEAIGTCVYHTYTYGGNTCTPYVATFPNVAPGLWEFTFAPWDPAGIPSARDYRVTLTCSPDAGCVVDGEVAAPGSYSGNTCGAGRDCDLTDPGAEEQMLRIIIPDDDDWVFDLTTTWSSSLRLMSACCDSALAHWHPDISNIHLTAGEYFLDVGGVDGTNCGAYTLNVYRYRGQCCYVEPDYQSCADTSLTVCEALGGIFNSQASCSESACRYIPPCPEGALYSQRSSGRVSRFGYGFASDKAGTYQRADKFTVAGGPIGSLRFWGMIDEYISGPDCPMQPEPFRIRIFTDSLNYPGSIVHEYNVSLTGTLIDELYEAGEDSLFEYSTSLSPSCDVTTGWISIVGSDSDNCVFFWASSTFGDGLIRAFRNDTLQYGGTAGIDMAFCLGECVVDGEIIAPGSFTGNTCGAGDDCDWWTSPGAEDQIIAITFPDVDDWSVTIDAPGWSCRALLMPECCGNTWYPYEVCRRRTPQTLYYFVEGYSSTQCGAYTVTVTRCRQRCCYGVDYVSSCLDTTRTACEVLGGLFSSYQNCVSDPCTALPPCPDDASFSQQPYLPEHDDVDAWLSDPEPVIYEFEQFSGVTLPITSVRFWGIHGNAHNWISPCVENPMPFTINFYTDDAGQPGTLVASRSSEVTGVPGDLYCWLTCNASFTYDMLLTSPVTLDQGWISIVGGDVSDTTCHFYWLTSPTGDGDHWLLQDNTLPYEWQSGDLAFCLTTNCPEPDSLTLIHTTGIHFLLSFWAPMDAAYKFYYTNSTTAEYPTGFTLASQLMLTAGHQSFDITMTPVYQRWLVVTNCGVGTEAGTSGLHRPTVVRPIDTNLPPPDATHPAVSARSLQRTETVGRR